MLPGFFCSWPSCRYAVGKGDLMANHFTPQELAAELGTETREVIQFCLSEGIPIYKGKIDRSLLTAVMKTKGIQLQKTQVATA
jgi:hypothetical protein